VDGTEAVVIAICSLFIAAGVAIIWMAMQSRRQIREMEHRERLAMIERGMVPPPEVDPGTFDRQFSYAQPRSTGSIRTRVAGVFMISLGLAFMFMLTLLTGEPAIGVGVGGAFAIVGAGFLVSSFITSRPGPIPLPRAHQIQQRDVSRSTPPDLPTS
jgi:hypothetical protein